jgi:uncharacterized protein (UPF0548 family)
MFSLLRPSPRTMHAFLDRSRALPLSYGPIGLVDDETAGRNYDHTLVVIGRGRDEFERARTALASWKQFDLGWVELFPHGASHQSGTDVAVLIRHLGFWSLNGARVVYTVGDRERGDRFGYAYGTLTNHAERGEELFEVAFNADSGDVTYRIRAASWPRAALTRIGYPIARLLQAQFRRDSVEAMRRAASGRQSPS